MSQIFSSVSPHRFKQLALLGGVALVAAAATFLAVNARAAGIPAANALTYSGYLETPDGQPISDKVDITISVWDAVTAGKKVCTASAKQVTPVAGRFQVPLPDCAAPVGASPDLWLEATVDDTSLGRTKLGAVPYAVEAHHAASAEAAAPAGPLATQIVAMQADIDALKARSNAALATKLSKYTGAAQVISTASYVWVSGTDAAKLAPGRYWAFNTGRAWASGSGCAANCDPMSVAYLTPCMKVGTVVTPSTAELVAEPPRDATASLPWSVIDYFDFDKETANVQLGVCARRNDAKATSWDTTLANVYTTVLAQPK